MDQAAASYDQVAEARRLAGNRLRIVDISEPRGWAVYRVVSGRGVYIGRRVNPAELLAFVKRLLR